MVSFPDLCPGLPWWAGNEVRPSQESHSSDTKYCTVQNYTVQSKHVASFPDPSPASRRLQYGKAEEASFPGPAFLQATESWAWTWGRGCKKRHAQKHNFTIAYRYSKTTQTTSKYSLQPMQNSQNYRGIGRPANSHGFTVSLTISLQVSRVVHFAV